MFKILRWILGVITLIPVTVVALSVVVALTAQLFGYHFVVVEGQSNQPFYNPGDLMIMKESGEAPQLGDMIEFPYNGHAVPTIHAVVHIGTDDQGTFYQTQGKNEELNGLPDKNLVRPSQVEGVMVKSLAGYADIWNTMRFQAHTWVWAVAMISAVLFLALSWGPKALERFGYSLKIAPSSAEEPHV